MLLVLLSAVVLALFARLHSEAVFYFAGPVLGAALAAMVYRQDPSALIKGGLIGGLCGGVTAMLLFKHGYIYRDVGGITGPRYLASLAVHCLAGLAFGSLLFLMFRWARPSQNADPS